MGSKNRYLILIILMFHFVQSGAQTDFRTSDSLTFDQYLKAEWTDLIISGNNALKSGIDYKHLRQRIGYARFIKNDYLDAKKNFRKAYEFDKFDPFTLEYLYYSQLNLGKQEFTGSIEKRMPPELLALLNIKKTTIIQSVEAELCFKSASTEQRSKASFNRIGLSTKAGSKLSLNQSFSYYSQYFGASDSSFQIKQPDYYLLINWNIAQNLLLRSAWHYTHTRKSGSILPGNLFLAGAGVDLNRLYVSLNTSLFRSDYLKNWQTDLSSVLYFRCKSQFYVITTAALLKSSNTRDYFILGGGAGLRFMKNTWFELNAVSGGMRGYNDFNGLYVYNTLDKLESRLGFTLRKYYGTHLSFWANLSKEKYGFYDSNTLHFRQISFLGGIKWKI
ncbi:MAG TPA: hypothetical protein VHO50_12175 [Bacteroidales bacterium]|nr:hypothetical protein [Bacteroidales bacterium]